MKTYAHIICVQYFFFGKLPRSDGNVKIEGLLQRELNAYLYVVKISFPYVASVASDPAKWHAHTLTLTKHVTDMSDSNFVTSVLHKHLLSFQLSCFYSTRVVP